MYYTCRRGNLPSVSTCPSSYLSNTVTACPNIIKALVVNVKDILVTLSMTVWN